MTPKIGNLYKVRRYMRLSRDIVYRPYYDDNNGHPSTGEISEGETCLLVGVVPGSKSDNERNHDKITWYQVLAGTKFGWTAAWAEDSKHALRIHPHNGISDTRATFDYYFDDLIDNETTAE